MFHQELPFPAPLSADHYLSPLTLKWLILHFVSLGLSTSLQAPEQGQDPRPPWHSSWEQAAPAGS